MKLDDHSKEVAKGLLKEIHEDLDLLQPSPQARKKWQDRADLLSNLIYAEELELLGEKYVDGKRVKC